MTRFGTTEFLRRCGGISTTLRDRLEADGIIAPQKTGRWRSYSQQDVAATLAHLRARGRKVRA